MLAKSMSHYLIEQLKTNSSVRMRRLRGCRHRSVGTSGGYVMASLPAISSNSAKLSGDKVN
jgi:hypothetical protein